jgi:hypothetical protein
MKKKSAKHSIFNISFPPKLLWQIIRSGNTVRGFLIILLFFFRSAVGQIPNYSFENWTNGNPDWWQTTNIPIVPRSIIPDTDAYEGNLSVKGIVVSDVRNKPFAPYLGIYGPAGPGVSCFRYL